MFPIQPGRIFWAIAPGNRGAGKIRPMIMASHRSDVIGKPAVFAIVCTSTFGQPLNAKEVELPWRESGLVVTGLKKPTVAVCDWTEFVPFDEIESVSGVVPREILLKIFALAGISPINRR